MRSGSRFSIVAFASNSFFSLALISSFGAIHSTLPFLRMPRFFACMMMSSAWSHGTSFSRSVSAPVTESLVTMLKFVKSAITCSSERTSMFWKLSDSFSPV